MLRTDEIHETNEDLTVMTESERKFSKSDYGLTAAASDRAISGGAASNFKAAKRCLPYVFLTVLTLALLFLPLKKKTSRIAITVTAAVAARSSGFKFLCSCSKARLLSSGSMLILRRNPRAFLPACQNATKLRPQCARWHGRRRRG